MSHIQGYYPYISVLNEMLKVQATDIALKNNTFLQQGSQFCFPQLLQAFQYNDLTARIVQYQQNQYLQWLKLHSLSQNQLLNNNEIFNGHAETKTPSLPPQPEKKADIEAIKEKPGKCKVIEKEKGEKVLNKKKQRVKLEELDHSQESSTTGSNSKLRLGKRKSKNISLQNYDEKVMLLGTKEEYEKFFKDEKTLFTENELLMVNQIDQPRKRKKKGEESDQAQFDPLKILEKEVSPMLREEIKNYLPLFEEEVGKLKDDKGHQLMIQYFPEMYKNVNKFYIFIKAGNERKKQLEKRQLLVNIERRPNHCNKSDTSNIRKIWDSNKIEDKQLQDYLFALEKQWPNSKYRFSQELILDLLKINNYDYEVTRELVSKADVKFKTFVKKHYQHLELKK